MLWYDNSAVLRNALLAQLDRVFGYEPKGQGFESLAARHPKPLYIKGFGFFYAFFEVVILMLKITKNG